MSTLTRDAMLQRNADDKEHLRLRMLKKVKQARDLRHQAAIDDDAAAAAATVAPPTPPAPTPV